MKECNITETDSYIKRSNQCLPVGGRRCDRAKRSSGINYKV